MGLDPKMAAKLKNFNKNFAKEKKRADELGGFAEIPDGKYLAKVSGCEIKNSNAGEMHLVFQFKIMESAEDESLVGAKASKWCNIEKEDGGAYLIRDLRRFGIELEDLTQLPEVAKMLDEQKPEVKISLKTGNSGQFTYIDTVISEIDAGEHAASEEAEDEDDSSDESDDESDDDEGEEEGEEGIALEVGTKVKFTTKKGEDVDGEIVTMDEKAGTVDIKAGTKSFKGIAVDRLSIPEDEDSDDESDDDEEDEGEEEEVKPVAKKSTAKKAASAKKVAPARKSTTKKRK